MKKYIFYLLVSFVSFSYAMDDSLNRPESWSYDPHAMDRMKEHEISEQDISDAIKFGEMFFDQKHNSRVYTCRKRNQEIRVCMASDKPLIITVYPVENEYRKKKKSADSTDAMSSSDSKRSLANVDFPCLFSSSSSSSLHNLTKAEESERERESVLKRFKADFAKVYFKKTDGESVVSAVNIKEGTIEIIFPNKEKYVLQVNRLAEDHATRFPTGFTYEPKKARKHKKATDNEKKFEALDFIMKKFGVIKDDKGQESFKLVLPARKILDAKPSISGTIVYEIIKRTKSCDLSNNNTPSSIDGQEEWILKKSYFEKK